MFIFGDPLGTSEINNPCSRMGGWSYKFKAYGGGVKFRSHKKCPSFISRTLINHFSFYFCRLKNSTFSFINQGHQESIAFFSICLNLSANLFFGNMLFVRNIQ